MSEHAPSGDDLYIESVRVLTAAAQRQRANGDQPDFADFLAKVLAGIAANVGGPDRLIAGRPGSWEAELVQSLAQGIHADAHELAVGAAKFALPAAGEGIEADFIAGFNACDIATCIDHDARTVGSQNMG